MFLMKLGNLLLITALLGLGEVRAQMGPHYEVPSSVVTGRYKGGTLREVRPLDGVPRGEWWTIFEDSELNRLQDEALRNSQTLKGAVARFDQARAAARLAKADFFPTFGGAAEANYLVTSENQASAFPLTGLRYEGGSYKTPFDFNWEIDLWGKVRRENESVLAEAYAAGELMQHALLSLHAEVAMTYFQLRARDAEAAAVAEAVELRHDAVRIAAAQVNAGTATDLEKVQAETELELARSEQASLEDQRSQLLHALAILTGAQPAAFALERRSGGPRRLPAIPAGVPSDLLERRPDIAAAERRLAAAAARVGVAKAAAYPSVQLTGLAGYDAGDVELLLDPLSFFATVGPKITVPIFSGGRNKANIEKANATHAEILADYRQTILVSFGEVENSLSTLRLINSQLTHLNRARSSAGRSIEVARARYRAGSGLYLEVIQSDRAALEIERSIALLQGQQLTTTVALIKALGGGWDLTTPLVAPPIKPDPVQIESKAHRKEREANLRAEPLAEGDAEGETPVPRSLNLFGGGLFGKKPD